MQILMHYLIIINWLRCTIFTISTTELPSGRHWNTEAISAINNDLLRNVDSLNWNRRWTGVVRQTSADHPEYWILNAESWAKNWTSHISYLLYKFKSTNRVELMKIQLHKWFHLPSLTIFSKPYRIFLMFYKIYSSKSFLFALVWLFIVFKVTKLYPEKSELLWK